MKICFTGPFYGRINKKTANIRGFQFDLLIEFTEIVKKELLLKAIVISCTIRSFLFTVADELYMCHRTLCFTLMGCIITKLEA